MAWIKFEKDLLTDPRVLRMAKNIGTIWQIAEETDGTFMDEKNALPTVTLVVGGLVRIWCLADTHVDEDDVLPLGFEEIDQHIGIPGFCGQMPREWIEPLSDKAVRLPNYHGHNGTEAKRKAVTQKRVAAFRSRNAQALPDQTKTRPRPKEEKGAPKVALPDWVPLESWKAWLEVRAKVKAPNTERALKLALADLDRLKSSGQDPAAVLDNATKRGWKGLFAASVVAEKPTDAPKPNICSYCSSPASGSTGGYKHCSSRECFDKAMGGERPRKTA